MSTPRSITTAFLESPVFRTAVLPVLVGTIALAVAVIGSVLTGDSGEDGVNGLVEGLSSSSGTFLARLGSVVPLGFAFAAGLVSAVNPCGFAMLPAYLGLYLGCEEDPEDKINPLRLLARALLVGGLVTFGFVLLFSTTGLAIGLGAHAVVAEVTPWFGLGVGVVLAVAGAWLLGGGKLYSGLAARLSAHLGDPGQVNVRGYLLFGLSYGVASLSCTLPIFLIVVGTSLGVADIGIALAQFVLYALGMGLVIMALTVGTALFKGAVTGFLRRALPYIQPAGALLMILAGSYIVFYWLTVGGLG